MWFHFLIILNYYRVYTTLVRPRIIFQYSSSKFNVKIVSLGFRDFSWCCLCLRGNILDYRQTPRRLFESFFPDILLNERTLDVSIFRISISFSTCTLYRCRNNMECPRENADQEWRKRTMLVERFRFSVV